MSALLEADDIGEIIAESISSYFHNPDNIEIISRLKAAGLNFEIENAEEHHTDALKGMTIVISGNFSIPRNDMKKLIELNGGKNSGSISGKTSYLLAGEKAGPEKLKKAEALGVMVITEADFNNMIAKSEQSAEVTETENNDNIQLSLF